MSDNITLKTFTIKLKRVENYESYQKYLENDDEKQRRSERVREIQLKKLSEQRQHLPKIPRRKSIEVIRKTSPTLKSILKSSLRSRAKSVSFDPRIVPPVQRNLLGNLQPSVSNVNRSPSAGSPNKRNSSPAISRNVSSVQRKLFGRPKISVNTVKHSSTVVSSVQIVQSSSGSDGQADQVLALDLALDLSKKKVQTTMLSNDLSNSNAAQMKVGEHSFQNDSFNDVGYYVDVTTSQNNNPNSNNTDGTNALSSDEKTAYELRIKNLVDSNRAKINRILELQADRSGLMAQNESLDRVNRILAKTIDDITDEDNVSESNNGAQIRHLENEIGILQGRVDTLNRENNGLRSVNDHFKSCLESFGRQVLSEHNYSK